MLPNLKDLVHPCQRLVQKIRMQGMEGEFAKIVAGEGFNPEEWAYTCDKTIKAYRVLRMSSPELLTLLCTNATYTKISLTFIPTRRRRTLR